MKKIEDIQTAIISDFEFEGRVDLTSVCIPNCVQRIGIGSFMDCSCLKKIVIPDGITIIGDSAFTNCTSLNEIIIPASVSFIGECAFSGCTKLTKIVLPEQMPEIGINAFGGCPCQNDVVEKMASEIARREEERKQEEARRKEEEQKAKKEAKLKAAKEEAERKAKEEYEARQAPYDVYIDKVSDMLLAMMTARKILGWSSADFRKNSSSLPMVAASVEGRETAEETTLKLNKGGFLSHIESVDR